MSIESNKLMNLADGKVLYDDLRERVEDRIEAPSTPGSSGQVLTSDGQGGQSWQTPTGGDPTEIIDDTAGAGDTDKVWSADKTASENSALMSAIALKQNAPATAGTAGQVLGLDSNLDPVWVNQQGGGGGTSDYSDLTNKPQIAGVTLSGNKSLADLGIASASDMNAQKSLVSPIQVKDIEWENKGIGAYDGSLSSRTDRIKNTNPLPHTISMIKVKTGYSFGLFAYDSQGVYVGWWDGGAWSKSTLYWIDGNVSIPLSDLDSTYSFYIVARNTAGSAITSADIQNNILFYSLNRENAGKVNSIVSVPELRAGSNASTSASNCVAINNIVAVNGASSVTFVINKPLASSSNHFKVTLITFNTGIGYRISGTEGYSARIGSKEVNLLPGENIYTVNLDNDPDVKGVAIDIAEYNSSNNVVSMSVYDFPVDGVLVFRSYIAQRTAQNNYFVDSGFIKHKIQLERIGALKYPNAFTVYDNKYYCINGSKIAVYNSSFSLQSDIELDTGHGNSLQLGSNGVAYASGWNDNKIYVIDLTNLEVTDMIVLPTTGYTTGVVDDVNGIAYIFQRDSYPDTVSVYNFIAYDYVNEQVISTKKTSIAFRSMQACDLCRGRIIVLYGNGSNNTNGYVVFDTSGNVIGEYVIGDKATDEPEGVFVDRSTNDVYMSYISEYIYKIVQS